MILGFRQARQDDQERCCCERGVDGRRMEEEIREGKREELEAQDQDGETGGGIEKVRFTLLFLICILNYNILIT